jgi:hypothetical protein
MKTTILEPESPCLSRASTQRCHVPEVPNPEDDGKNSSPYRFTGSGSLWLLPLWSFGRPLRGESFEIGEQLLLWSQHVFGNNPNSMKNSVIENTLIKDVRMKPSGFLLQNSLLKRRSLLDGSITRDTKDPHFGWVRAYGSNTWWWSRWIYSAL